MIERKTLGLLGGALVALIAVSFLTSKQKYNTTKGGGFASILDAGFDAGQVQSFKAWIGSKPDSAVVLERSGEGWTVPSRFAWSAKTDLVQQMIDDLTGMKGELRSSNAEVLKDYQLDDDGGLHVVASTSGGTEMFHLVAGKNAPAGGSFVRRAGSNDVYVTRASLRSSFGVWGEPPRVPDPKRWINLEILKVERNDVDRVTLVSKEGTFTFEKEFAMTTPAPVAATDSTGAAPAATPSPTIDRTNWTWKPDARGELDKGKVDALLGTLCSLYAAEVVDPTFLDQYGFGPEARVAELVMNGGTTTRIEFGKATTDEKKVYVRVGEGMPAEIYTSTVDRIFQKRSELSPAKQ